MPWPGARARWPRPPRPTPPHGALLRPRRLCGGQTRSTRISFFCGIRPTTTASKYSSSVLNGVWRSRSCASVCRRLDSTAAGSVSVLRKHFARRQRQYHLGGPPHATVAPIGERGYRCASRAGDGRGVAGERDRRRRQHHGAFAVHARSPERRVVAVEHQHGAHATALQRGAWLGGHQRAELRGPPGPEAGDPRSARELRETGSQYGQGQFTDGHCSCLCRQPNWRRFPGVVG